MAHNQFYDTLTPFVSVTLGLPQSTLADAALAAKAVESVAALLSLDFKTKIVSDRIDGPVRRDRVTGAAVRAFRYKRRGTPGWTSDEGIVDIENHLVLAVALAG